MKLCSTKKIILTFFNLNVSLKTSLSIRLIVSLHFSIVNIPKWLYANHSLKQSGYCNCNAGIISGNDFGKTRFYTIASPQ